jgi:hypothetical protein
MTDSINNQFIKKNDIIDISLYNELFVLVKKTDVSIPFDFYKLSVSSNLFDEISNNFIIHKTTTKILQNPNHLINVIILSDNELSKYNIFNYKLSEKNLVLPILNIKYHDLIQYLEQYESNNNLENLYKIQTLNSYFKIDNTYIINDYISTLISNLEESFHWCNKNNCLINFSKEFIKRTFNLSMFNFNIFNLNIIRELNNMSNENYINIQNNKRYVDISCCTTKSGAFCSSEGSSASFCTTHNKVGSSSAFGYCTTHNKVVSSSAFGYCSAFDCVTTNIYTNKNIFTKEDINSLFLTLNKKQRFLLFSNMLVSYEYCHLIITNSFILICMKETINKFAPLFRYLLSYTWLTLYNNECNTKNITTNDNFIFDINTANLLPIYPFNHAKPTENPYMPILISHGHLNPQDNWCGVPEYFDTINKGGICNLNEFIFNINIFCTENPKHNIFENFDFINNQIAITGSVITACIQKYHPLMYNYQEKFSLINRLNKFYNEYYSTSDVDVIIIAETNEIFIEKVNIFYKHIKQNIININNLPKNDINICELILNKVGQLFVSEQFIENNDFDILNFHNLTTNDKIKYINKNINTNEIKNIFMPYYKKLSQEYYQNIIKNLNSDEINNYKNKYTDIFVFNNIDFKIYIGKYTNDIELVFNYKYHIKSNYIKHHLELFPCKYNDFFGLIGKFHLPCVRGYYNGDNVYLTPSCISAHMTYMNIDYKYIAGSKDPLDIINKNRMRGFGTWLNDNEIKLLIKYSYNVPKWNKLYYLNKYCYIRGILQINNPFYKPDYKPDKNNNSQLYKIYAMPKLLSTTNISISAHIQYKFNSINIKEINYDNFISINNEGNVIPLNKNIINYTWFLYENFYKNHYHNNYDNI